MMPKSLETVERVYSKEISFIKLAQNTVLVGAKRTEKIEYNKKRMDYIAKIAI